MYSSSAMSMVMPLFLKVTLCVFATVRSCWPVLTDRVFPSVLTHRHIPFGETDNRARCLRNLEVGHHHHVLVLEVVTVEDVAAPVAVETDQHARLLARAEAHDILPAGVGRERFTVVAGEHLEVNEVEVDRVRSGGRSKVPDFGEAQLRTGGHVPRVERFAVDLPHRSSLVADPGKAKHARAVGVGFLELMSFSVLVTRKRITSAVLSSLMRFF